MTRCACCQRIILFGGVYDGADRYCSKPCRSGAPSEMLEAIRLVPDELVLNAATEAMLRPCQRCGAEDAVCNLYRFHWVWSFVWITRSGHRDLMTCPWCRRKQAAVDLIGTTLGGWWALPIGPLVTIDRVVRNAVTLLRPSRQTPTPELLRVLRIQIGIKLYHEWKARGGV